MARQYQWRATTTYKSDTPFSYGVSPSDKMNWQTVDIGSESGSMTFTWWYRDSNTRWNGIWSDNISSRVAINVTESWTTSVDEWNNLTVTINASLGPVVRDDIRGGGGTNNWGRSINFYIREGGASILSLTDWLINTAHTLYSGPLTGTYSFTIAPGGNYERSTLYVHNQTINYASYDDIWVGIQFRNILPRDYRPGATYNGLWYSTDRSSGACNLYTGSSWREMRTLNGGSATNKPPRILHSNNTYYNQRRVGNG